MKKTQSPFVKKIFKYIPHNAFCVAFGFFVIMLFITLLSAWTFHLTVYKYNKDDIITCSDVCISVKKELKGEPLLQKYRTGDFAYELTLKNGTKLTVYADVLEKNGLVGTVEQIVSKECTFAYIPINIFLDNAYALLSVSDEGKVILTEQTVMNFFEQRIAVLTHRNILFVSLFIIIIPLIYNLCKQWRIKSKRKAKKKKKEAVRKRIEEQNH